MDLAHGVAISHVALLRLTPPALVAGSHILVDTTSVDVVDSSASTFDVLTFGAKNKNRKGAEMRPLSSFLVSFASIVGLAGAFFVPGPAPGEFYSGLIVT